VQHRDDDDAGEQRHHQREPVQRVERRRARLEHDAGCPAEGAEIHHQDAQRLGQRQAADREIQPPQAEQAGAHDKGEQRGDGAGSEQQQRQRRAGGVAEQREGIGAEADEGAGAE
jgi:hypothetical protein